MQLQRVIVFAKDIKKLTAFYRDLLGLEPKLTPDDPRTWLEFEAGSSSIALHNGGTSKTGRAPKLVFFVPNETISETRAMLNERGANFGKLTRVSEIQFCNGTDPERNELSLSSRT
jgi:catechol 2,3-dioxygenase-like lactoylglutathione lyase family enzyme